MLRMIQNRPLVSISVNGLSPDEPPDTIRSHLEYFQKN
jgi:hypothetical protein